MRRLEVLSMTSTGWWAPKAGDRVTAGLYGATLDELVEAVRRVAPPQVGNSLAELSC